MPKNTDEINSCKNCFLSRLCFPQCLSPDDINQFDAITEKKVNIEKGQTLVKVGDPLTNIFAVKSGSCKSVHFDNKGNQRINSFFLPGEIIGLEALHTKAHVSELVALEDSKLCVAAVSDVLALAEKLPKLQEYLLSLMSQKLQNFQLGMQTNSAEQQLASFLLTLSSRREQQMLSPTNLVLPMSRTDVANYLGLSLETISRSFNKLKKQKLISTEGRNVSLLSLRELQKYICE